MSNHYWLWPAGKLEIIVIILGIDPGIASMGYGVIKKEQNKLTCLAYGCLRTSKTAPDWDRLKILYHELIKLIQNCKPQMFAIEKLFFFKNAKTAMTVAQARGVALLAAADAGLEIKEFTPLQVKQATACYGLAQKNQIQKMVKAILCLKEIPQPDDAADALAIAVCAANSGLS